VERERNATLQQLITAVQRRWGARALRRFGQLTYDAIPMLATGFTELDAALGIGGIPRGRITEFLGTPTSGMSTMSPCAAAPSPDR
jgi:recombination protein RecA